MEATKCIVNGDSNECYQSFTVKRTATPPFKLTGKSGGNKNDSVINPKIAFLSQLLAKMMA